MSKQNFDRLNPVIGEVGNHKVLNWHGFKIVEGTGHSAHILNEIQSRKNELKQNMFIIVGSPGDGKSYYGLRLAEILDPKFNPFIQIVFDRRHFLWLLSDDSPLKIGSVIIIDESHFIIGSRNWYVKLQQDLMENLEAVRSKGYCIIIVALHLSLLDRVIRKFVLSHMMKMRKRGSAIVYKLFMPLFDDKLHKKRLGGMSLQLPGFEDCNSPTCLTCSKNGDCCNVRAIYERRKKDFLAEMAQKSQIKAEKAEQKQKSINYKDTIEKLLEHKNDFVFTSKGNPEPESIRIILEEKLKLKITTADANRIIKRGQIQHPEVFLKKKAEE